MKMQRLSRESVDEIAEKCLYLYEKLVKNGKPVECEWTVVSCVVQLDASSRPEVVSLGTGTKCCGAGALASSGAALNDSHAEVCARRAFLLYLYDNLTYYLLNKPSIFYRDGEQFRLKENIQFVFYSSQLPCGDASILPKDSDEELFGDLLQQNKRSADEDISGDERKTMRLECDTHRTGAKCLPDGEQDRRLPGLNYHTLGQVRTKPGRGDRTLSVSCSDKMARWIHVGIQGALFDLFCGPIYIKHFIFGDGVPYSADSLNRALLNRKDNQIKAIDSAPEPEFYKSNLIFPHRRTPARVRPAPGSIIWVKTYKTTEVAVRGKKLGLTRKQAGLPKHALCISKYKMYEKFLSILQDSKELKEYILKDCSLKDIPYNVMKIKSVQYNNNWNEVKKHFFGCWTRKPDIWSFCVNMT